jgi:hypothetical protein
MIDFVSKFKNGIWNFESISKKTFVKTSEVDQELEYEV